MWTRRGELLVAWPLMLAVRHTHPALARLETQVPAIADIVAFIGVDFTRMIKLEIPEELTGVTRWLTAMRARPAATVAV